MSQILKYYHSIDLIGNQLLNSRLHNVTTTTRIYIGGQLNGSNRGFQVYDTDLKRPFYWNGSSWDEANVSWGSVTGSILDQTDLINYLSNNYYPYSTNPLGYLTNTSLAPYLTSIDASNIYVPLIRNITINGITQNLSANRSWNIDTLPTQMGNAGRYLKTSGSVATWSNLSGNISLFTNDAGYLTTETDPTVPSFVKAITNTQISNWNTAYGWGNHAIAGYLTSLLAASTYTPLTRNLTINGVTYNLSSDRTWNINGLPSQTGNVGRYLQTDGTNASWQVVNALPNQTGNAGKFLTTDGALASWSTIPLPTPAALTKTDDTNITLTLTGSPSTSLLQAVGIAVGWTGTLDDSRITSATTWNAKEPGITAGTTSQYWRGDKTWQTFPTIPTVGTWGALNYPTWTTGTPFVKMDAAGSFILDTNTYLTSAITSLGGLTGATQTFVDDTNVTMVSSGTTHTLTWAGTLADSRIASASTWNAKQDAITLTTTGTSGASTFIGNTLNIPTYTLAGLGGQPQLNGTGFVKASGTTISYDNSTYITGNQTITLSGDVTGSGATSISTSIADTTVTGKTITGYVSGAGTVTATDTILQAIQKLNGNTVSTQIAVTPAANLFNYYNFY